MLTIIPSNILVIIAVTSSSKLRTIPNSFIVSLACSDLTVGLVLPYHTAFILLPEMNTHKYLCLFRIVTVGAPCGVSIINLCLIAFDRYICVVRPLSYHRLMTAFRAKFLIGFTWIYGTFCGTMPLYWNTWRSGRTFCTVTDVLPVGFIVGIAASQFVCASVIMAASYVHMCYIGAKHRRRITELTGGIVANTGQMAQIDMKGVKTLALVLGLFDLCWLPYFMYVFVIYSGAAATSSEKQLYSVNVITATIAIMNSALNPFIYGWRSKDFREAYKKIVFDKIAGILTRRRDVQ